MQNPLKIATRLASASVHRHMIGGCVDAFYFLLAFAKGLSSNERPNAWQVNGKTIATLQRPFRWSAP
jgi:hypothetical protein